MDGPLTGVTVIDVSTLGPGPFASMILADFGAEVIEIRRPGQANDDISAQFARGKTPLAIDIRAPGGSELVARLTKTADVFLEGYRPGTMERRSLGPDVLRADNPRLVYTRLTGWGQTGPYAATAGHDINYVAVAGALGAVGFDTPIPALNLLGDFASGSLHAVLGTVLALLVRNQTGYGQIVDAAMVDGAAYLMSAQFAELARGLWCGRGTSMLSGIAPFYSVYRCADNGWIAVGAIEARFYAELLNGLGLDHGFVHRQRDREHWSADRTAIAAVFATRARDHWASVFADTDACAYPVFDLPEVIRDPHIIARGSVVFDDNCQLAIAPAPKLSHTPGAPSGAIPTTRRHQLVVLAKHGVTDDDVTHYEASGALHLLS